MYSLCSPIYTFFFLLYTACLSCLSVCPPLCIYFVSCAYVASDIRAVEGLFSGILNEDLNGVTMTPDTSTLTPAASAVSPSSPAARLSISQDLLHAVSSHLAVSALLSSSVFHLVELLRASMDQCSTTFLWCLSAFLPF